MDKSLFFTSDLWLAAYLKSKGMRIARIEGESRRAVFVFENVENGEKLIKEFYSDSQIGILTIKNAMTNLKSAIFNMG